jgi:hypothetical protein
VHHGRFRVDVGSHREHTGQGGRPLLQLSHEPCPAGDQLARLRQLFELRDDQPPGHRDRFVVTHQRPVQGELEKCRLPADRVEHRLAAHSRPGGHGIDGRA